VADLTLFVIHLLFPVYALVFYFDFYPAAGTPVGITGSTTSRQPGGLLGSTTDV
jgi:hypothetical protein